MDVIVIVRIVPIINVKLNQIDVKKNNALNKCYLN